MSKTPSFDLSKGVELSVQDGSSERTMFVHEEILAVLPFFSALPSERWSGGDQDAQKKSAHFELPCLSTHEDFAAAIHAPYGGRPLPKTGDLDRAVGMVALAKMLQAEELAAQALLHLGERTTSDGETLSRATELLRRYGTLEDVSTALKEVTATFDDDTCACAIRGHRSARPCSRRPFRPGPPPGIRKGTSLRFWSTWERPIPVALLLRFSKRHQLPATISGAMDGSRRQNQRGRIVSGLMTIHCAW